MSFPHSSSLAFTSPLLTVTRLLVKSLFNILFYFIFLFKQLLQHCRISKSDLGASITQNIETLKHSFSRKISFPTSQTQALKGGEINFPQNDPCICMDGIWLSWGMGAPIIKSSGGVTGQGQAEAEAEAATPCGLSLGKATSPPWPWDFSAYIHVSL